jgi:hypothetical protein
MLLNPAQARLNLCSGFAQACSPLLRPSTIFGTLRRSMLNCFNSSRVGPELVPCMRMARISALFENEQPEPFLSTLGTCPNLDAQQNLVFGNSGESLSLFTQVGMLPILSRTTAFLELSRSGRNQASSQREHDGQAVTSCSTSICHLRDGC